MLLSFYLHKVILSLASGRLDLSRNSCKQFTVWRLGMTVYQKMPICPITHYGDYILEKAS